MTNTQKAKHEECVKKAHRNGKRAGYRLGFDDGYKTAHNHMMRHLSVIMKLNKKEWIKTQQPITRICSHCFKNI